MNKIKKKARKKHFGEEKCKNMEQWKKTTLEQGLWKKMQNKTQATFSFLFAMFTTSSFFGGLSCNIQAEREHSPWKIEECRGKTIIGLVGHAC